MTENKMKRDNVKLMMTNKLLKKRVKRLEKALQAIMDSTEEDFPSLEGISLIAYMALNGDDEE